MFSIDRWMEDYRKAAEKCFGDRIWFLGLQGSYGRGEASRGSDIDAVLILDRLGRADLLKYSSMLDTLPERGKACGFISGKEELLAWEPSELFQFYYDTEPVIGSLDPLLAHIGEADIRRAVRTGACSIYHMCAHNLVHEKSGEILKSLYKSAVFALQAAVFLKTGVYEKKREGLRIRSDPEDRCILETGQRLKQEGEISSEELEELSSLLLDWASGWIRRSSDNSDIVYGSYER